MSVTPCKYRNGSECTLATACVDPLGVRVHDLWCYDACWPNNPASQVHMLKRLKADIPPLPEGRDMLEWAKQCLADGRGTPAPPAKRRVEEKKKAEAERQRLLAELPNDFKLAANLARHLKKIHAHYKATGRVYVSPEMAEKRRKVCRNCPGGRSVVDGDGILRCTLKTCGCRLTVPLEPKGGAVKKALDAVVKIATGDTGAELLTKPDYEALECEEGWWADLENSESSRVSVAILNCD